MSKVAAEICCGSWMDCVAAEKGGAQRVELNSALFLGGLTPSVAALKLAKEKTNLKVICMVRPRPAGFCYNEEEIEEMFLEAKLLLEAGADGIAFGFLDESGEIDVEKTKTMIECIHHFPGNREAVFHRAFDCCEDPFHTIETLIELKADRILTSGLKPKAMEGIDLLKKLQNCYGNQIEILAGSGMNALNAFELYRQTGITQIHSSCKGWRIDKTTTKNHVTYRYHEADDYEFVDEEKVRDFVEAIEKIREDQV